MRRKQIELEQAVIAAAHNLRDNKPGCVTEFKDAIDALRAYEAEQVTGAEARWAEGSPETSREAAKLAWPVQKSCRLDIIALLANVPATAHPGYTDAQLEHRLKRSHQTVSSARNWLVQAGWLRDSGVRRFTPSHRKAVVWMLTDAAVRQLKEGAPS